MSMLQNASLHQLDYSKVTEFSRRQLMEAMGAQSMEEAAVIHKIVGRTTTEYLSRIEFERRRTEERLVAAAHSNEAVRAAFGKYSVQMEDELQALTRFLLRQDHDHALPRTPRTAARLLETLRGELDRAEVVRKDEAAAAALVAQHSLAATVAASADSISPAEAMKQLAKSKPNVWLRLKEQEAQLMAEEAALEADELSTSAAAASSAPAASALESMAAVGATDSDGVSGVVTASTVPAQITNSGKTITTLERAAEEQAEEIAEVMQKATANSVLHQERSR
jgi:hypothetical protein